MRWALKIAYLGEGFHGFQRQPNVRTVEGDLLEVLESLNIIADPVSARFQAASRTDRGVCALGNVVAFSSDVDPREAISLANSRLRGIWLHAYDKVPEGFNPRKAKERWYRYHLPGKLNMERLEEGANIFLGRHDFSGFSKGESGVCHVRGIQPTRSGESIALDIVADRFLRGMVRRIASGLQLYSEGTLPIKELKRGFLGEKLGVEPACPEFLWLMDVGYDLAFRRSGTKWLREQLTRLAAVKNGEVLFLEELLKKVS